MKQLKNILGNNIRRYRNCRELTIEQLAFLAGVSTKQLGQIERATQNCTIEMVEKIAKALMVNATALFATDESVITKNGDVDQLLKYCFSYVETVGEEKKQAYCEFQSDFQRALLKLVMLLAK